MPASAHANETIVRLVPGGDCRLSHLSDDALLISTRRLVGASNEIFAQLLLHLAEVETRGIHRTRACSSLYTYCIYELRMSEDAAARRSSAARLVKQFPLLFDAIARGELHLTGLLMLGPHLTAENHVEVLARAKFRTKKELAKLVRELHPLPSVPDLVEPLGPKPSRSLREPTWEEWVTSLCPPVRELEAGDAPRAWANDAQRPLGAAPFASRCAQSLGGGGSIGGVGAEAAWGLGADGGRSTMHAEDDGVAPRVPSHFTAKAVPGGESRMFADDFTAPARRELPPITAPQQYQMQFSTTEAHVRLVERAKALLARSSPGVSLGGLHLQAMQLLVARLEKEKFGGPALPRLGPGNDPADQTKRPSQRKGRSAADPTRRDPRRRAGDAQEPANAAPRQRGTKPAANAAPPQRGTKLAANAAPRRRGRHVPTAVKREVFARDAGCCSYVDARGNRCSESRYLELHHLEPFARGGQHVASNLTLRCTAHNALAAEEDFGRSLIEQARRAARHESFSSQAPVEAE